MVELKEEDQQERIFASGKRTLQDYLSLGYLYLLILGIITNSVNYGLIGINYIAHSTVLDVLLSPIAIMTEVVALPAVFVIGAVLVFIITHFPKYYHQKNREKEWYQKKKNVAELDHKFENYKPERYTVLLIALIIFSGFSGFGGFGLGRGLKMKNMVESGTYKVDHELTFQDGERLEVGIIGKNSTYVFYVPSGEKKVVIAPISGNVKYISKLKRKKN